MEFKKLRNPFTPAELEWRAGATNSEGSKALAFAYVTARAVMNRLDDVAGPDNWMDRYEKGPEGGVMCIISIRLGDIWIEKAGMASNTDVEPIKGGESDAFKRAAVKWGIGRYLYEFPDIWCPSERKGKTVVLLERPALPAWAYPEDYKGEKETGMISLRARLSPDEMATKAGLNIGKEKAETPAEKKAEPKAEKEAEPEAPAAEKKAAPAEEKPTTTELKAQATSVADSATDPLYGKAIKYVVPAGYPMVGQTLGEVLANADLARKLMPALAGEGKRGYKPTDEESQKFVKAAKYLIQYLPAPQPATESK